MSWIPLCLKHFILSSDYFSVTYLQLPATYLSFYHYLTQFNLGYPNLLYELPNVMPKPLNGLLRLLLRFLPLRISYLPIITPIKWTQFAPIDVSTLIFNLLSYKRCLYTVSYQPSSDYFSASYPSAMVIYLFYYLPTLSFGTNLSFILLPTPLIISHPETTNGDSLLRSSCNRWLKNTSRGKKFYFTTTVDLPKQI